MHLPADPTGPRRGPRSRGDGEVSEEARAVYATVEATAGGGAASAATLLEAAGEFEQLGKLREVAELCERARKRIDTEQISRKIGLEESIDLDNKCMWRLAGAYDGLGKLTLACEAYGVLMKRPLPGPEGEASRRQAKKKWALVSVRLAKSLEKSRRFQGAADVYELVLNTTTRSISGDILYENTQLYLAMALQKLDRVEEAKELANDVARNTVCRKRRAQAHWIFDVFEVELEPERNEAFHEVWEQHFKLPEDSLRGGRRFGIGGTTSGGRLSNLTPRQIAQKTWIRKYWEERLSGPVYNSFLVLFVTWPFAIPVVALMNK